MVSQVMPSLSLFHHCFDHKFIFYHSRSRCTGSELKLFLFAFKFQCLEVVTRRCRCGLHMKELPCQKEFLCETKCKQIKDCGKHPCNRKCCDGNCSSCEKPCGRNLRCGIHKCASACHRGPCYPCRITVSIKCKCGGTSITVPCGRQKKTKPPKCSKLCK